MDIPPSPFKNRLKEKAVSGIDRKALSYLSALSGGALVKPPKMGGKLPKVQRSSLWCKNLGIETKADPPMYPTQETRVFTDRNGRESIQTSPLFNAPLHAPDDEKYSREQLGYTVDETNEDEDQRDIAAGRGPMSRKNLGAKAAPKYQPNEGDRVTLQKNPNRRALRSHETTNPVHGTFSYGDQRYGPRLDNVVNDEGQEVGTIGVSWDDIDDMRAYEEPSSNKNLVGKTKEIKVTVGKDGRQYCYDYAAQQRVDCDEVDKHPREAGRLGAEGVEQEPPPQGEDRRRRPTPIEENEKEQIIYAIIEFVFSNYPEDENTETRKQEAYAYLDQFSLIKLRKIYQDLAKTNQ